MKFKIIISVVKAFHLYYSTDIGTDFSSGLKLSFYPTEFVITVLP